MKSQIKSLVLACLTSLFLIVASDAQTLSNTDTEKRTDQDQSTGPTQRGGPAKASVLIGAEIQNKDLQTIGSVQELAVDLQAGRIVQVIVATAGFLAIRERHVAVPPRHFDYDATSQLLHFDVAMDRLQSAPGFQMSDWAEFYKTNLVQESCRYYGDEPSFAAPPALNTQPALAINPNGLGQVEQATKLVGRSVTNLQNEDIGAVVDLIVDLPAGRVVAVIVSSSKFLGISDALSAIPPAALRFSATPDQIQLTSTKETLLNASHFTTKHWPDFGASDYVDHLYRAYRIEPYSAGARTARAKPQATPKIAAGRD